jgi:23S rRNA pseudouridine1911/1915/1917 synthase
VTARSITVPLGDDSSAVGDRIDRVLCARLEAEGLSRSLIARLCEEGRVRVQGRPVKASYKLRKGDVAVVDVPPPEPIEALPENIPLTVVYEDPDLLVVDKPAGLVVHPARGHAHGTLVNAVLHHAEVDDEGDPLRPGIVHRIDRMTSGLLVVAKSVIARESLMERFRAHDIERSYLALSEGVPPSPTTYDTLYDRHPGDRVRFSSRVASGRRAVTHIRVLESLAGARAAYIRCTLETGRTHQIRVHLADAGYPLLGDAMYGRRPRHDGLREVAEALGRQALHAEVLGFAHPVTGVSLRFTSPPPEDFARALATLRMLT